MVDRLDPLVALLDEARATDRAAARRRGAWLRRQAEEEATLAGALLDLSERGSLVTIGSTSGRTTSGTVAAVARDFVVLRSDRADACIALAAVSSVRLHEGERHGAPTGSRQAALDLVLVEVLAGLSAERPRVALVTGGDGVLAGELVAVGADVVTLRMDGDHRTLCYVAVATIEEALLARR
jgi:hypothetical protein